MSQLDGQSHAQGRRRIPAHRRRRHDATARRPAPTRSRRRSRRRRRRHRAATPSPASCSAIRRAAASCTRRRRHTWSTTSPAYAQDEFRVELNADGQLRRCATSTNPACAKRDNQFTVGFDRDADFPGAGARPDSQGRPDVCRRERISDSQGQALNGVAPRGGVRVVALGQGRSFAAATASTGRRCSFPASAKPRWAVSATRRRRRISSSTDGNRTPANSLSEPVSRRASLPPQGNSLGLATGAGGVIDFVDQNSQARLGAAVLGRLHARDAGRHRGRRSATRAAGRSTCRSAARLTRRSTSISSIRSTSRSGSALLDLVPNPFFGNTAFGNLRELADDRARPAAAAVSAVHDVLAHRVSEARTRYNAMTLRFDRRLRNNWGVNANYTFSRLMDNQFGESNTYVAAQRRGARQLRPRRRVGLFAARRAASRQRQRHVRAAGRRRPQVADRRARQRAARWLVGDGGRRGSRTAFR